MENEYDCLVNRLPLPLDCTHIFKAGLKLQSTLTSQHKEKLFLSTNVDYVMLLEAQNC